MIPAPPAGANAAPPRTDPRALKLEVIAYSEQRPQRWAFMSGWKYVEGDTIGDGVRAEEIQATDVILNEDGRRVTLCP